MKHYSLAIEMFVQPMNSSNPKDIENNFRVKKRISVNIYLHIHIFHLQRQIPSFLSHNISTNINIPVKIPNSG